MSTPFMSPSDSISCQECRYKRTTQALSHSTCGGLGEDYICTNWKIKQNHVFTKQEKKPILKNRIP